MVIRKILFFLAGVVLWASPAFLLQAQSQDRWYAPRILASADEAANRLHRLVPLLTPVAMGSTGSFIVAKSYTFRQAEANRLGITLRFQTNQVTSNAAPTWTWAAATTPPPAQQGYLNTTLVYSAIVSFPILYVPNSLSTASWCTLPSHRDNIVRNDALCANSENDLHDLVDALATLSTAAGANLLVQTGVELGPVPDKILQKHPEEAGCLVQSIVPASPAEISGLKTGDILRTIDGTLCNFPDLLSRAVNKVFYERNGRGVVHLEGFRKDKPLPLDLRYPVVTEDLAALRRSADEMALKLEQKPSAAASPNGPRFGFEVRAVNDGDVSQLALPSQRGILITAVAPDSLAERMGIKPGDVVLCVNNSEIGDLEFFVAILRTGKVKSFCVWRAGQRLQLSLPESL